MKEIQLYNRYQYDVKLKYWKGNDWVLEGDFDAMQYTRVSIDEDGSLLVVDPSGGPYLSIGTPVADMVITKIDKNSLGYVFTLEKKKEDETDRTKS